MMRGLGFVPANHSKEALHCETIKTKSKSSKALFGRAVDMYEDFVLVSGFGKTDSQFVGSAFLYMKNTNENLEPIACLRDGDVTELFGHSVSINSQFIVIGDPSSDIVHVYNVRNLLNGNPKKWHNSNQLIKAPQQYLLEIH